MMLLTLSRPTESDKSCGATVELVTVHPGDTHRARGKSKMHRVHDEEGSVIKLPSAQFMRTPHKKRFYIKYIKPNNQNLQMTITEEESALCSPSLKISVAKERSGLIPAALANLTVPYVAVHVTTMTITSAVMRHERDKTVTRK